MGRNLISACALLVKLIKIHKNYKKGDEIMDNSLENKNEYIKFEKTSSFELQCNSEKRIRKIM